MNKMELVEHKNFYEKLSPEEKGVCNLYKSNSEYNGGQYFANELNNNLREGKIIEHDMANKELLLDKMAKYYTTSEDMILYRADNIHNIEPFINNGYLKYPAYMSTAQEDFIERHFSGIKTPTRLKINCPATANVIPMEGNLAYGGFEQEILLGKKSEFKVDSKTTVTGYTDIAKFMGTLYAEDISELVLYELTFIKYYYN